MPIKLVMPSNHLIFCHPLLLLPSIFPSIRVFSNESVFCIRWPNTGVSASASVLSVNTQDWSPSGWTGWISLLSKGPSRVFSNTTVQKHQFWQPLYPRRDWLTYILWHKVISVKRNLNWKHYLIENSLNFYYHTLQTNFGANPYKMDITRNLMELFKYLNTMKHFEMTKRFSWDKNVASTLHYVINWSVSLNYTHAKRPLDTLRILLMTHL